MQVIRTATEMQQVRSAITGSVGLVATLGGIHIGHIAHMETVRPLCDVLIGSVFLNPTQFGANEDLSRYPSNETTDLAEFGKHGVDIVFAPSVEEMYPPSGIPQMDPGPAANTLEGLHRPGHFSGVATVVARLFSIISPSMAAFGEKDAQQLRIIQHVNEQLGFGIDIIPIPTVRESDGLAASSRNVYLSPAERKAAVVLHRALAAANQSWKSGERSGDALRAIMTEILDSEPLATTEYASIADIDTFQESQQIGGSARALLAVNIGTTRLIDNLLLG
jgi:pantoate--beta-alanine ligase